MKSNAAVQNWWQQAGIAQMARRMKRRMDSAVENVIGQVANRLVERAKVDHRISFPCYKAMDEFIDVERLKLIDQDLTNQIQEHIRKHEDSQFHTGTLVLDPKSAKRPGSRIIFLSKSKRPYRYLDLDKPELWEPTPEAGEFPELMALIATFPFRKTARMMIMYDDSGKAVTAHRDHAQTKVCHEFMWFRTNLNKPFYMVSSKTGAKKYVESYAAWFDTCNQFHGADASGGLSVSLRVDGVFTDEFRARIPVPKCNRASTPSLWACTSDERTSLQAAAAHN
jgi:hypothetical protein